MPFASKLGLSVAVAFAALLGCYYMHYLHLIGPQWAVTFLGPFMVASLWVFPEVMRKSSDGHTPRRSEK